MTPTIRSQPAQLSTTIVSWPLIFHALLSLGLGAVIYVFFRQHLAIFIPGWIVDIHSRVHIDHAIPATLTQSLPSFFHMYALILASHALFIPRAGTSTNYFKALLTYPCAGSIVIGFGLEIIQHPVFNPWLTRLSTTYSQTMPILSGAAGYGAQGTYDANDIVAIGAAALLATAHVFWLSKKINRTNDEISSSHKQPFLNGDNG